MHGTNVKEKKVSSFKLIIFSPSNLKLSTTLYRNMEYVGNADKLSLFWGTLLAYLHTYFIRFYYRCPLVSMFFAVCILFLIFNSGLQYDRCVCTFVFCFRCYGDFTVGLRQNLSHPVWRTVAVYI